jgi:hypothetical protein
MATEQIEKARSQLDRLAEPFPSSLIKQAPAGKYGTYVKHSAVTERLLSIVGAFSYEIVQVIHGYAPPVIGKGEKYTANTPRWPGREHALVGCVGKLTVWVDGREVSVEEAGDVDDPAMENDGRNLKDASSDAIKRCAMRLGLGLHLWSQDDYFLDRQLKHDNKLPSGEGETLTDDTDDPEAQATREKYRERHAAVNKRQEAETTATLQKEAAEMMAEPDPEAEAAHDSVVNQAFEDLKAAVVDEPVADVIPISGDTVGVPRSTNRTPEELTNKLEWEVGLDTEGRMKCKGACERTNPFKYDQPCCKSAHLRRLYNLAEGGLELEHEKKFKDLLHQALAKKGAAHVSELRKGPLDSLISVSKDTFMGMLYGTPGTEA